MKIETDKVTTLTSGNIQTKQFSSGNIHKLMDLVADRIYSNKILAPIRELVCNAHDAHIAAGTTDVKYLVHLPSHTDSECQFFIRDYGTGLTPEEVEELYTSCCASSKDKTNTAIGGFGIGSKAPFAYSTYFELFSYKDGFLNKYVCNKDASTMQVHRFGPTVVDEDAAPEAAGKPRQMKIDPAFRGYPTTEPNGLKVSFPVKSRDVGDFRNEMAKLFMFQNEIEFDGPGIEWSTIPEFTLDFATLPGGGDWYAEMGGVLYTITSDAFQHMPNLLSIKEHTSYNLHRVIHVEVGEIDITPSREQVEWTTKSIQALDARANRLIQSVGSICKAAMRQKDTMWQKLQVFRKYQDMYRFYRPGWYVRSFAIDSWRGLYSESATRNIKLVQAGTTRTTKQANSVINHGVAFLRMVEAGSDIQWVDLGDAGKILAEVRIYSKDNPRKQLLCTSDANVLKLLRKIGAPMMHITDFAKWKPAKPEVSATGSNAKKASKQSTVRGVRLYSCPGKAPTSIEPGVMDVLMPANKVVYYILQKQVTARVADEAAVVHVPSERVSSPIVWAQVYSNYPGLIVVSEEGLKKLKTDYPNTTLVDVHTAVRDKLNKADSILPLVSARCRADALRGRLARWEPYYAVCKHVAQLFVPRITKELLVAFDPKATQVHEDKVTPVDMLLFRHDVNSKETNYAISVAKSFEKVIGNHFLLLQTAFNYTRAPYESLLKELAKYVKINVAEVKKSIVKIDIN